MTDKYYVPPQTYQDGSTLGAVDLNADTAAIRAGFNLAEVDINDTAQGQYEAQFRSNSIFNGRFTVWNEGTTVAAPSDGDALAEMWYHRQVYTGGATFAYSRIDVTGAPSAGFTRLQHEMKFATTIAGTAPTASEYTAMSYRMEGHELQPYQFETGTLVFEMLSNIAGDISVVFTNGTDRWYVTSVTVAAADTNDWIAYFVPFPFLNEGGGTWNYANGTGLHIHFTTSAGSSQRTSTPNTWQTGEDWAVANQLDGVAATADIRLANVIMMPTIVAKDATFLPPVDVKPVQAVIALTQRYFEHSFQPGVTLPPATGAPAGYLYQDGSIPLDGMATASKTRFAVRYQVRKASIPTVTLYSSDTGVAGKATEDFAADVPAVVLNPTSGTGTSGRIGQVGCTVEVDTTGLKEYGFHLTADSRLG